MVVSFPVVESHGSKYHLHPNGLGWVSDDAFVDESAYIAPFAVVRQRAKIGPGVKIGERARIHVDVNIEANVWIGEEAEIGPSTVVERGCSIGGRTQTHNGQLRIGSDTKIGSSCEIWGKSIGQNVIIGNGVKISPQVEIGNDVTIEYGCQLGPQNSILEGSKIGPNCKVNGRIRRNVTVGFMVKMGSWVLLCDNSEVQSFVTLDHKVRIGRGSFVAEGHKLPEYFNLKDGERIANPILDGDWKKIQIPS